MRLGRIFAALVLLVAGGVAVFLALTIPNDVHAEAILRDARASLQKNDRDHARQSLERLVQRYPRTDAAATAAQTLFMMDRQDLQRLQRRSAALSAELETVRERLGVAEQKLRQPTPSVAVVPLTTPPPPVATPPSHPPSPRHKVVSRHKPVHHRHHR